MRRPLFLDIAYRAADTVHGVRRLLAGILVLAACGQSPSAQQPPVALDVVVRQLAAAHTHGERDNHLGDYQRLQLLKAGDLVSFCGEVSDPAAVVLHMDGFKVRRIAMLALTPDATGVYQGHQLLEVWHPERGRWVVVDVDYGVMFDQPAASLPDGRVAAEWLEAAHGNPERPEGYPLVADAVGVIGDDGHAHYDPIAYTTAERAILEGRGWVAD